MDEPKDGVPRLYFDRRLKLEFHGSKVNSDAGLAMWLAWETAGHLAEGADNNDPLGNIPGDGNRGKAGSICIPEHSPHDQDTLYRRG